MANPLDYLMDLIPKNTNMFGASPNANLKTMSDMGLLGGDNYADMLAKAKKQSMFQGLLNTGLSYAAQPKNQGYGSIFPYLAKAGLSGMEAAQRPYDQLTTDAITNQKLQEMKRANDLRLAETKFREGVLPPQGSSLVNPNKQVNVAPYNNATNQDYGVGSSVMGGRTVPTTANPVSPNFGLESVSAPMAQELGVSEAQLPKTNTTVSPEEINLYKRYTSGLSTYEDYMSARQNLLESRKPTYKGFKLDEDVFSTNPDGTLELVRKGITKASGKSNYTNTPIELFVNGKVVSAMMPTGEGFNQGLKPINIATRKPIESSYTVKPTPLTDSQGENKQHSTKMGAANAIFTNQLENEDGTLNYDPLAVNRKEVIGSYYLIGDASAAVLNKYDLSPQDRQASQAKKTFINSILRKESGAAIAQSEFDNADSQYFPQYGDDQQTIINKRITRDLVTKTMAAAVNGDPKAETEIQQIIAELSIYKPPLEKKPRTKEQKALLKKYREGE